MPVAIAITGNAPRTKTNKRVSRSADTENKDVAKKRTAGTIVSLPQKSPTLGATASAAIVDNIILQILDRFVRFRDGSQASANTTAPAGTVHRNAGKNMFGIKCSMPPDV